jgi:hypothetical protein
MLLSLGDNTSAIQWLFHLSRVHPSSMTYYAIQIVAHMVASWPVYERDHFTGIQEPLANDKEDPNSDVEDDIK